MSYNHLKVKIISAWLDFTVTGISGSRYLGIFESLMKFLGFIFFQSYSLFFWALALGKSI